MRIRAMRSRLLSAGAGIVLVLASMVAFASPASAHCGGHSNHRDDSRRSYSGVFAADGVRIRTHPHNTCTILGLGYRSHRADVHCGIFNSSDNLWIYLRNLTTGVKGWVYIRNTNVGIVPPCR